MEIVVVAATGAISPVGIRVGKPMPVTTVLGRVTRMVSLSE